MLSENHTNIAAAHQNHPGKDHISQNKRDFLSSIKPLDFPLDCPRLLSQKNQTEYSPILISQTLRRQLQTVCRQEDVPLSIALLSVFLIFLQIYTDQEELVIGTQFNDQSSNNIHVLNPLIRQKLTFGRLLEVVSNIISTKKETTMMPIEELGIDSPVRVLFGFRKGIVESFEMNWDIGYNRTCLDLELHFLESEDDLKGIFRYRKGSFKHQTIQRLEKHFLNVAERIIENPKQCIGDVNIVDEEEGEKLVKEWNDTKTDSEEITMVDLFNHRVSLSPQSLAVICGEQELTYDELHQRSNTLAHYLRNQGLEHEALVGVCMDRSSWLIISFLAILKAGGAYLPLDPSYPIERLDFMLEDSKCEMILTEELYSGLFSSIKTRLVCVDRDWEMIVKEETKDTLPCAATPTSLAYVMYTSGSTGVPKGVLIEHKSVVRLVHNTNYFQATVNDRIAQIVNTSFDPSTLEIWSALLNGATLVCISRASTLNLASLEREIVKHSITAMVAPTALFNQIMVSRPNLLCPLKCVMFGGEEANPKLVQKYLDMRLSGRLLNLYGITEVTVCSTWFEITESSNRIPIGQPISNSRAYVLNHKLQPVPTGAVGELYLAGDGLARGYLNRSQDRFIVNPNPGFQMERMFRTGDLVRRRYDGNIEYLSRADRMVKIHGHRIELAEVQNVALQHISVKECVIVAFENDLINKRLVGYVTKNDISNLEKELVRECKIACDKYVYGNIRQEAADPAFNVTGWINTYNGEPIPKQEMREWLEETVGCIKRLNPRKVLEIGCGTGMILFNIAPQCEEYIGTDLSETALEYVQEYLNNSELKQKVQLRLGGAHELEGFSAGQFDTIILNSVVQHFPDARYLNNVLRNAIQLVRPGGHIFIGDIRGMTLAKYHYASQAIFDATESSTIQELKEMIKRKELKDKELLLDPNYFDALTESVQKIEHVHIMPKKSRSLNEMSKFRYQVVLHIKCNQTPMQLPEWLNWQHHSLSLEAIQGRLSDSSVSHLAISNIPNKRLEKEAKLLAMLDQSESNKSTYGELQQNLHQVDFDGVTPDQLDLLAKKMGFLTEISWTQHEGGGIYDVVFWRPHQNNPCIPFKMPHYPRLNPKCHNNPLHRKLQQFVPELEKFMRTKLPGYMIPSSFVILDTLPLTANGKVDYQALPAPITTIMDINPNYVAPRSDLEETLADIMRKVLGVEYFGIHDTFLSLGGDSISAIEMAALCQKEGYHVSSLNIFQNPTVAMLTEYIGASNNVECTSTASQTQNCVSLIPFDLLDVNSSQMERIWESDILGNEIQKEHVEDIYPCVPLQSHTVYETTLDKNAELHQIFYDIKGPLDIERLRNSCIKLCQESPMLRTVFVPSRAGVKHLNFIQIVIKKNHFHLVFKVHHCTSLEEREKAIETHLAEDQEQGIQLGRNMLRFALFTDKSNDHKFLWAIHHALMDGWTMQLLLNDLIEIYESGAAPERPPYRNFVESYLKRDHLADIKFWSVKLAGVSKELLPRQLKQETTTMVQPSLIKCTVTKDLMNFCKEQNLISAALFKAAWVTTVGLYARANEVLFGDVVFGRNMELDGVDKIIGPCFNVLPVRIKLNKNERFLDLIRRIQEEQNSISPFENTNVGEILSMFSDEREMHKIYGSYIAFQNFRLKAHKNSFGSQISLSHICGSIHLTIILEASPIGNGLDMKLTFDENILSQVDASNHMQLLCSCLEYIVDNPYGTLATYEASIVMN